MTTLLKTINDTQNQVKEWKRQGLKVGLVPTMGALHKGHASLIKKAAETTDKVIVSVFVNPTQFGANEDFSKYPRTLEKDVELAEMMGATVVFAPNAEEMYGKGYEKNNLTLVMPPYDYVNILCGKTRTGHFDGVSTVVLKLFNITQADVGFFGQKDAQQLFIIKNMVKDLNIPIEIIGCPIVRDDDNLAVSSRNQYLTTEEREKALTLSKVLFTIEKFYKKGITSAKSLFDTGVSTLANGVELEYLDFLDYETLKKSDILKKGTLIAICAKVGTTRLIDNIVLD